MMRVADYFWMKGWFMAPEMCHNSRTQMWWRPSNGQEKIYGFRQGTAAGRARCAA
jgi:hypothetical protein